MTEPQRTDTSPARPWWREHVGWLLGGLPIIFALFRVAGTARFNPVTAGAIVGRSDPLTILASVFFIVTPLAVLVGAVPAWTLLRAHGAPRYIAVGYVIPLPVAVALLAPVAYLLGALLLLGLWFCVRLWEIRRPAIRLPLRGLAIGLVSLVGLLLLLGDVWVPGELVTHARGRIFGYVIGEQGGWLTVLRDDDRTVEMLTADDVTGRLICRNPDSESDSIPDLFESPLVRSLIVRSPIDFLKGKPGSDVRQCPKDAPTSVTPSDDALSASPTETPTPSASPNHPTPSSAPT